MTLIVWSAIFLFPFNNFFYFNRWQQKLGPFSMPFSVVLSSNQRKNACPVKGCGAPIAKDMHGYFTAPWYKVDLVSDKEWPITCCGTVDRSDERQIDVQLGNCDELKTSTKNHNFVNLLLPRAHGSN